MSTFVVGSACLEVRRIHLDLGSDEEDKGFLWWNLQRRVIGDTKWLTGRYVSVECKLQYSTVHRLMIKVLKGRYMFA